MSVGGKGVSCTAYSKGCLGYFELSVAFPLAVYAAAIRLVVQPHFFGYTVSLPEPWPEILVIEIDTCVFCYVVRNLNYLLMVLVWADEKSGGKSVKAVFSGCFSCLLQSHPVANRTAVRLMPGNRPNMIDHFVLAGYYQWQVYEI